MHPQKPKSRVLRAPMIVLALAATLIVAIALPKVGTDEESAAKEIEITSRWDAEVKRVDIAVGDKVEAGTPLVTLIDPKLEEEILQLENELKLTMLGTKEAVVEEGISGGIGSLPRVVWSNPAPAPLPKKTPPVDTSAVEGQVKTLSGQADAGQVLIKELSADKEVAEASAQEARVSLGLAETDVRNAESRLSDLEKDWDKMQRLYDMGAIPKKKLDASVEAFQSASADVVSLKDKVSSVQATIRDFEKVVSDLKDRILKANKDLADMNKKIDLAKNKASELRKVKNDAPSEVVDAKPVKRIIYGSISTEESHAPLQVNLVDVEDPNKEARIAQLRTKILELRKKRDALRIVAPATGYVQSVIEPGTKVSNLDTLVVIGFAPRS